ncbi:MAG: valine--tRNA ligase [Bacilli bacterium]|nr:valine--tRNA ligase [Bacilli bacterium]
MLETKYNHKSVEIGKYENWKSKGYFEPTNNGKGKFSIVIPPPNVTGKLHLGHAWDTTLQDIIVRFKRMQGFDTLWLPGMDHAAIATEAKVVAKLKSNGINKYELGREGFLKEAWKWKEEYAENIRNQWGKLGLSLAYSKERFTLDEGLNKAVTKVFVDLYNEGLIYRGERIINWDPEAKTALSNEEVLYEEVEGAFYHLKYYLEGSDKYLRVATTRPETLFGDTAVAVNPNDERYKEYIGQNVILPILNKPIPIVADEHADPEFGTGVVKITPAHDPNDFEVGNRHNLERIKVLNPDGTMNDNAGIYSGLDRFECRKRLIEDLTNENLLIEIEPITHSVGHSERTSVMVEPYLSKQWFVKMEELAKRVLEIQKNEDEKVNFVPERFEKILNHWMEDCHDWCISRQLWWGHRIPAWYKGDSIYVGEVAPVGDGWVQDEDVLDTWFSSALWPFSTFGWPDKTEDLEKFFPTDVLVTGYDIIFFWVARMVFQGLHFMNQRPFKDCLVHGLIRDKIGRKMSKSLGNGVDPMDVIEEYGCDALRFFLCSNSAPGQDLRYDEEKVKGEWNFINKLWNASRYVLMNVEDFDMKNYNLDNLEIQDKYILNKMNNTIKHVTKHMEKYDFNIVGSTLYDFIWTDFCDNYIEMSKFKQDDTTKSVLITVLMNIIKMLHPFMPFVTEEIYLMMPNKDAESIMISSYPEFNNKFKFDKEEKEIINMLEYVTLFRNKLHDINCGKEFEIITNNENGLLFNLLKLKDKKVMNSKYNDSVKVNLYDYDISIYFDNSSNLENEINELNKEKDNLIKSIERREKLLSNENYVNKAPVFVVEKDRELLKQEKDRLEFINRELNNL